MQRYRQGFTTHQAHVRNLFKLLSPEGKEKTSYVDDTPVTGATEKVRGTRVLKLVDQTEFEVNLKQAPSVQAEVNYWELQLASQQVQEWLKLCMKYRLLLVKPS